MRTHTAENKPLTWTHTLLRKVFELPYDPGSEHSKHPQSLVRKPFKRRPTAELQQLEGPQAPFDKPFECKQTRDHRFDQIHSPRCTGATTCSVKRRQCTLGLNRCFGELLHVSTCWRPQCETVAIALRTPCTLGSGWMAKQRRQTHWACLIF